MTSGRKGFLHVVGMVAVIWATGSMNLWGQAVSGAINGTVTDATEAVISDAAVVATNVDTSLDPHFQFDV